jgi:hypothetical protein
MFAMPTAPPSKTPTTALPNVLMLLPCWMSSFAPWRRCCPTDNDSKSLLAAKNQIALHRLFGQIRQGLPSVAIARTVLRATQRKPSFAPHRQFSVRKSPCGGPPPGPRSSSPSSLPAQCLGWSHGVVRRVCLPPLASILYPVSCIWQSQWDCQMQYT